MQISSRQHQNTIRQRPSTAEMAAKAQDTRLAKADAAGAQVAGRQDTAGQAKRTAPADIVRNARQRAVAADGAAAQNLAAKLSAKIADDLSTMSKGQLVEKAASQGRALDALMKGVGGQPTDAEFAKIEQMFNQQVGVLDALGQKLGQPDLNMPLHGGSSRPVVGIQQMR